MPNLIALAIPAFIVLMAIEAIADALIRRDLYEIKDSVASITMGLGNVAVNLVAKTMQLAIFGVLYRFRIFHLGYQWWVWGLVSFADEFSYYWFHRASHAGRRSVRLPLSGLAPSSVFLVLENSRNFPH